MGTAVWPPTIFARQKTQEGSSLIQFHSYCQVSLALTGPGARRQTDRDLAIDLLNHNDSDCFFFRGVMILQNRKYEIQCLI